VKKPLKALDVKMPAPHFITFKLQDPKKSTRGINPFYVQKALDGIAGKVRNATRLKNGALLVDVFNEKEQMFSLRLNSLILILFTSTGARLSIHPGGL
jgi:hypothetical protein